jgi:alkylhydroperoxidase family enzyme
MALLNLIEKEEATGQVAEIYENMINTMGFIPNAFKIFSPSAHLLNTQVSNLGYYMRHKTLGGKLLAFIRLLVSEQEQCTYCVGMNSGILLQYGVLPEMIAGIISDPATAPLEGKDLAMLLFVLKVVKSSNSIEQPDVDHLRNLGWNDGEILEATYHATNSMAVDKIFNAFKIPQDR